MFDLTRMLTGIYLLLELLIAIQLSYEYNFVMLLYLGFLAMKTLNLRNDVDLLKERDEYLQKNQFESYRLKFQDFEDRLTLIQSGEKPKRMIIDNVKLK